jgi:hypothetical protein
VVDEALDDDGRERIAAVLGEYTASLPENPLRDHPERLPLRIVGDGRTPRYHDARAGEVTLHSRESLAALADVLGDTDLSELRFRSNVAIEGLEPWEELGWGRAGRPRGRVGHPGNAPAGLTAGAGEGGGKLALERLGSVSSGLVRIEMVSA